MLHNFSKINIKILIFILLLILWIEIDFYLCAQIQSTSDNNNNNLEYILKIYQKLDENNGPLYIITNGEICQDPTIMMEIWLDEDRVLREYARNNLHFETYSEKNKVLIEVRYSANYDEGRKEIRNIINYVKYPEYENWYFNGNYNIVIDKDINTNVTKGTTVVTFEQLIQKGLIVFYDQHRKLIYNRKNIKYEYIDGERIDRIDPFVVLPDDFRMFLIPEGLHLEIENISTLNGIITCGGKEVVSGLNALKAQYATNIFNKNQAYNRLAFERKVHATKEEMFKLTIGTIGDVKLGKIGDEMEFLGWVLAARHDRNYLPNWIIYEDSNKVIKSINLVSDKWNQIKTYKNVEQVMKELDANTNIIDSEKRKDIKLKFLINEGCQCFDINTFEEVRYNIEIINLQLEKMYKENNSIISKILPIGSKSEKIRFNCLKRMKADYESYKLLVGAKLGMVKKTNLQSREYDLFVGKDVYDWYKNKENQLADKYGSLNLIKYENDRNSYIYLEKDTTFVVKLIPGIDNIEDNIKLLSEKYNKMKAYREKIESFNSIEQFDFFQSRKSIRSSIMTKGKAAIIINKYGGITHGVIETFDYKFPPGYFQIGGLGFSATNKILLGNIFGKLTYEVNFSDILEIRIEDPSYLKINLENGDLISGSIFKRKASVLSSWTEGGSHEIELVPYIEGYYLSDENKKFIWGVSELKSIRFGSQKEICPPVSFQLYSSINGSLIGSTWVIKHSKNDDIIIQFLNEGLIRNGLFEKGHWKKNKNLIHIEINNIVYEGKMLGNTIAGEAWDKDKNNWKWYANAIDAHRPISTQPKEKDDPSLKSRKQVKRSYKNTSGIGLGLNRFQPQNKELDTSFGPLRFYSFNLYENIAPFLLYMNLGIGGKETVNNSILYRGGKYYSNLYIKYYDWTFDWLYNFYNSNNLELFIGTGIVLAKTNLKGDELSEYIAQNKSIDILSEKLEGSGFGLEFLFGGFYNLGRFNIQCFLKYQTKIVNETEYALPSSHIERTYYDLRGFKVQIGLNYHN